MGDASPHRRTSHLARIALGVTAGLIAFVLTTAWSHEYARRESAEGRREQLADLVASRQRHAAELEEQLSDARRRLDAATRAAGRGLLDPLEQETARLTGPAGTGALDGPGLVVELADSALAKRGDAESADFMIQDADVQLVVNALWASGAEAIGINGQRVVATTAIRSAGGAILVNYRVLSSPYRIVALGNGSALENGFGKSSIARRFRSWASIYQLGFAVKREGRLSVPAYAGSVSFRYAKPAESKS